MLYRGIFITALALFSQKIFPSDDFVNEVPDWAGTEMITDLSGKKIHLKDMQGDLIIVTYWETSCPWCRAFLPEANDLMPEFKKEYKNKKIRWILENIWDGPADIKKVKNGDNHAKKQLNNLEFYYSQTGNIWALKPGLQDENGNINVATPTTVILDSQKKIVARIYGYRKPQDIKKIIHKLMMR